MTIPNQVRACAEALAACGGALNERVDRLDVRGTPEAGLRAELAELATAWCGHSCGAFEAIDVLGEAVAISALSASDGELRVSFIKAPTVSTYYFLTARGLAVLLDDRDKAALARRVLVAEEFEPFRTLQCKFERWTGMVDDAPAGDEHGLPVPRRIVRDQLAVVPLSIGPLLLTVPPQLAGDAQVTAGMVRAAAGTEPQLSAVFKIWRDAAIPQLLLCLADEIWRQDGEIHVALTGPRKRKLCAALDKIDAKRDFKLVTEVADWVFNSGRDVETRHTLFVYELAREWPDEDPFASTFAERAPGALEAAKTAFRMHVRDASKETLKSLQELRKTLADDVSRVVTQTRELTGTLWRDLLVVVAAVLGRSSLLTSPTKGAARFGDALLFGLAIYLIFSLGMVLHANARFMTLFRGVQTKWQVKLYGFVDPEDFKSLATEPLREAESVYGRARNLAIAAYTMTVLALIALAILPTSVPPQPNQDTNKGAAAAGAPSAAANATHAGSDASSVGVVLGGNGPPATVGADRTTKPGRTLASGPSAGSGGDGIPNAKGTENKPAEGQSSANGNRCSGGPMH